MIDLQPALLQSNVSVKCRNGCFIDSAWKAEGVTEQFLENSDAYHDQYFDRLDFLSLSDRCLAYANIDRDACMNVLDIGSGGGSSVLALSKLLINSNIVASDISPYLLEKLVAFAESRPEIQSRVSAYCFDLHVPFFKESVFDLIYGAAILHHLQDPLQALRHVVSSLKAGGKIVLVEPMEGGCLLLTAMYENILNVLESIGAEKDHPIRKLMEALRTDIHARLGVPDCKPWTKHLDDKWVFNRPYLSKLASDLGCRSVSVYKNQPDLSHLYEDCFRSVLADSGNASVDIPPEVLRVIHNFDRDISCELKEVLCPTGIIVIEK